MNRYIKKNIYKNEKGLVKAFPCSWATEPWSQDGGGWEGGGRPPASRDLGRGVTDWTSRYVFSIRNIIETLNV